jgi:hypothetical protein
VSIVTSSEWSRVEPCDIVEVPLSSERALAVLRNNAGDEIQLRSPSGEIELRIVITAHGPVVQLNAARVEVNAVDDVNFSCQRFAVHSSEETQLTTDGQLRLRAQEQVLIRAKQQVDIKGRPIRRNVWDGLFYDDYIRPINGPIWGTAFEDMPRTDLDDRAEFDRPMSSQQF